MIDRVVSIIGATLVFAMVSGGALAEPPSALAEPETASVFGLTVPATLGLFALGVVGAFAARKMLIKRK